MGVLYGGGGDGIIQILKPVIDQVKNYPVKYPVNILKPVIDPVKNYPVKYPVKIRLPVPVASAPDRSGAGQKNLLRSAPSWDETISCGHDILYNVIYVL